jgi:putative two-component system response regulator
MIIDDVKVNIDILIETLRPDYEISVVLDGKAALEAIAEDKPDLILLDIMMPEMDGYEVCKILKAGESTKNIPVIFITAMTEERDEAKGLALGAVDYITKPFSPELVKSRVHNQLELKRYRDHLEELVAQRTRQLRENHIDTIYRLTLASEYKDEETGGHIKRISYYTRELALRMGLGNEFADIIFHASPMHDIGKVSIPDAILLKHGPLDKEELKIMKTHPAIGAKILEGSDSPLLQIAADIALCHHERWDGTGYPQGLKGEKSPLAARITMLTDIYDALRSIRPYKPAFDHQQTCVIMAEGDGRTMPEHFDPAVLAVFKEIAPVFKDIFGDFHQDCTYQKYLMDSFQKNR